jgi:hypothetical protein
MTFDEPLTLHFNGYDSALGRSPYLIWNRLQ